MDKQRDARVGELIQRALRERDAAAKDPDAPEPSMAILQAMPAGEMAGPAMALLGSDDRRRRQLGAIILKWWQGRGDKYYAAAAAQALRAAATQEADDLTLSELVGGLGAQAQLEDLQLMIGYSAHRSALVRSGSASWLTAVMTDETVRDVRLTLLGLLDDPEAGVRWDALWHLRDELPQDDELHQAFMRKTKDADPLVSALAERAVGKWDA